MKIVISKLIVDCFRILSNILFVISCPSCWIRAGTYSSNWDREINDLMSKNVFKRSGYCTARLGSRTVWIANHPYASFADYDNCNSDLPSRETVRKAKVKLDRDLSDDFTYLIQEAEKIKDLVKIH